MVIRQITFLLTLWVALCPHSVSGYGAQATLEPQVSPAIDAYMYLVDAGVLLRELRVSTPMMLKGIKETVRQGCITLEDAGQALASKSLSTSRAVFGGPSGPGGLVGPAARRISTL